MTGCHRQVIISRCINLLDYSNNLICETMAVPNEASPSN